MRIAIASAEPLFRDGLIAILESDPRLDVVAYADTIRETLKGTGFGPDATVIVDMRAATDRDIEYLLGAQEFGGFQLVFVSDGKDSTPQGFNKVVMRSDRAADLLKTIGVDDLGYVRGRRRYRTSPVEGNGEYLPKRGRGRPREITNSLPISSREYQAAAMIARGYANRQIADAMGIKEQSVKNLVSTIARKLGCYGRVQIANTINATLAAMKDQNAPEASN